MSRPTPKRVLPARGSKGRRPDLSVGGGGAFHTPHGPDGGSSLLESEHGSGSLLEAQQRRLEQAARDAFEREECGSDDDKSENHLTHPTLTSKYTKLTVHLTDHHADHQ